MRIPAREIIFSKRFGEVFMTVEAIVPAASLDWTKPLAERAKLCGGFCREAVKFASRRLQEQIEYFQELADCDDPVKVFFCNGRFLQRPFTNSAQDAQAAFVAIQSSYGGLRSS